MNTTDARNINIISYLESENMQKAYIVSGEAKFFSPFRNEKAPSFSHSIEPKFTTIVLNSTSLIPVLLPQLKNYKRINLFLDNDDTGQKAKQKFIDTGINTHDFSGIYKDSKDFNEFLMKSKS